MIRKDNVLEVEHLGGGKGTAYVHHIVSKEELLGHGRLYAKVVLPPGASVPSRSSRRQTSTKTP